MYKSDVQRQAEIAAEEAAPRLAPDDDLPDSLKEIWQATVAEFRQSYFHAADRVLLREYCRLAAQMREFEHVLKTPADCVTTNRFGDSILSPAFLAQGQVHRRLLQTGSALRVNLASRTPVPTSGMEKSNRAEAIPATGHSLPAGMNIHSLLPKSPLRPV